LLLGRISNGAPSEASKKIIKKIMYNQEEFIASNITSATTTQVYTGRCRLRAIVVNTTAAGTIKIIDGTSGTTANIGTLKASVAEGVYRYDCIMTSGIRIVTGAASDITVLYTV
jgi:hypothetical protein